MDSNENKLISIDDLNIQKKTERAFEFCYIDENNKETGIFFSVIGARAPVVQDWVNKKINQQRAHEKMQKKRGKDDDIRTVEEDQEFGAEMLSRRIVGWRGIAEPFSPERALTLCENNELICEQVREHSENISNFTKSK